MSRIVGFVDDASHRPQWKGRSLMAKQRKSKGRRRNAKSLAPVERSAIVDWAKGAIERGNLAYEEAETRVLYEVESKKEEARAWFSRIKKSRAARSWRA